MGLERGHSPLEYPAPLFKIGKPIKTRTSRREQNHAPVCRTLLRALHSFVHRGCAHARRHIAEVERYLVSRGAAVEVHASGSPADLTKVAAESSAAGYDLKALNTELVYLEVPGGNHTNVVQPNLAGMVEFFGKHKKP